jgi:CheY-like chemotaxis protein
MLNSQEIVKEEKQMKEANVHGRRVLVVDDEIGLQRSLHFGLAQYGFQTDYVEDGLSALRLIEASYHDGKPYDYVVSDIRLPDINGLKLLEVIKSKYLALPVIMISGYGTDITPDEVSLRKGEAYVSKPFLVRDLVDVLNQVSPNKIKKVKADAEPAPRTSASTYAMITVEPNADVLKIFRQLYTMNNVIYCDAVRDGYDIALLLNADTTDELNNLITNTLINIKGIAKIDTYPVLKPTIEESIRNFIKDYEARNSLYAQEDNRVKRLDFAITAYALVEVDKNHLQQVYPVIYFLDGVISCDATKGDYDIVVMIQRPTFKEIEQFVREEIGTIDGVVRVKLINIINMLPL